MPWSKDGVLTVGSGKAYVIDCVTGKLIPKEEARYIGVSPIHGGPYWIHRQRSIVDAKGLHPSKPKEEGQNNDNR